MVSECGLAVRVMSVRLQSVRSGIEEWSRFDVYFKY